MHRRDPSAVHHNPWTNEQHRRANGSDQICKYCTTQKKQRVSNGAAWSFCSQVNPAGNNEERANDNHECRVIDSCVEDPRRLTNKEVIETNKAGENSANFVVVTLPVPRFLSIRGFIHFGLFLICFYFGFVKKSAR